MTQVCGSGIWSWLSCNLCPMFSHKDANKVLAEAVFHVKSWLGTYLIPSLLKVDRIQFFAGSWLEVAPCSLPVPSSPTWPLCWELSHMATPRFKRDWKWSLYLWWACGKIKLPILLLRKKDNTEFGETIHGFYHRYFMYFTSLILIITL